MAYNGAKIVDYSRINPETGCGFILRRLADVPHTGMTRKEVYKETRYGHYTPGYHSSLWAKLMEDGLVEPDGGFKRVKCPPSYWSHTDSCDRAQSAWKKCAPTYFITNEGMNVFKKMMQKYSPKKEDIPPKKEEWRDDDFTPQECYGCEGDCSHCKLNVCINPPAPADDCSKLPVPTLASEIAKLAERMEKIQKDVDEISSKLIELAMWAQ